MKRITLCADDFGMHPDVSEAITRLAEMQRIQATSALVTSPYCQQGAAQLAPLKDDIDIGLHLNFTEGKGLTETFKNGLPGLPAMLWKSHCRLLSINALKDEIRAQLDSFTRLFGCTPDFIDGHQHVHHLPQVRTALFSVLAECDYADLWIRSVSPMIGQSSFVKSQIIEKSGAKALRTLICHSSFKTNTHFAGVYSLSEQESFPELMQYWLKHLSDGGLIMCHPAMGSVGTIDHAPARQLELNYLKSDDFLKALQDTDTTLSKLSLSGS